MMNLAGKRVLVLGVGVAGGSAVAALTDLGAIPVTVDGTGRGEYSSVAELDLSQIDHVVASPGFAPHSADVRAVLAAGLEVWSEMEFAWRVRREGIPWVLITGTNGKTTTTQMVGSIARAAGLDVAVCGNMGEPVIAAARTDVDLVAVEIASLQLHFTSTVSPHAAVCLNADEDHLDWHGDVRSYHAAKAKVYEHVQVACVYPAADAHVAAMVENADVVEGCRAIGVTTGAPEVSQLGAVEGVLCDRAFGEDRRREAIELGTLRDLEHLVAGAVPPYLVVNALSAAALARAVGIGAHHVGEGLRTFVLDAHRTALVSELDGVIYVDDSKATNAHATLAAFGSCAPHSVVWIAGGLAKGQVFDELVRQLRGRLRAVVLIGTDSALLLNALAGHAADIPVTVIEPGDTVMVRAVAAARTFARAGDTVLLSPACASMDQFSNYAQRGRAFAAAVEALEQ